MNKWGYNKYSYYLKRVGIGVVIVGCGYLYQLRDALQIVKYISATNTPNADKIQAQYIYLDDPRFKDAFMFHNDANTLPSRSKEPKTLSTIISKWWKSLNHSLAYRYVNIAKNGTQSQRSMAISLLGAIKDLKDWHYHQLALILDAKIAVALARIPSCDLRFFLKPLYYHVDKKLYEIIEELYSVLNQMDQLCHGHHRCLTQFLSKKFLDPNLEGLEFDHDLASVASSPARTWNQQLIMSCVEAIYHHSSIEQFSSGIGDAGGLQVLMDVQKRFANDINVCILLAKIISNLSLHDAHLQSLFQSGWIGILAAWSRHTDVRLAAPAARALVNLDTDANNNEKFPRRIYLLHPTHRTPVPPKLDVVFIHGLLGGVFVTWRQRDSVKPHKFVESRQMTFDTEFLTNVIGDQPQEFFKDLAHDLHTREWRQLGKDFEVVLPDCPVSMNEVACGPFTCSGREILEDDGTAERTECWPKDWLPRDLPSLRVIGINYDTNLSYWRPPCPIENMRSTMNERSMEFSTKLKTAGVGKRPIVWVCHSMGGLLIKQMLVEEWKNGDKNKLCANTKGIIFYSTPHRGSHIASLKQTTQMLVWPSIEVQELREESPKLLKLHDDFTNMLKKFPIEIVSFSETKSTLITALKLPLQFVMSRSANPGIGEFYEIPQDHLTICKPANRHSFLYRKVLTVLEKNLSVSTTIQSL